MEVPSGSPGLSLSCLHGAVQALTYQETENDEVEDMLQLIAHAQKRHPELQAVSSGAIASDYQRLRVEHVRSIHASRLHWTCGSGSPLGHDRLRPGICRCRCSYPRTIAWHGQHMHWLPQASPREEAGQALQASSWDTLHILALPGSVN